MIKISSEPDHLRTGKENGVRRKLNGTTILSVLNAVLNLVRIVFDLSAN